MNLVLLLLAGLFLGAVAERVLAAVRRAPERSPVTDRAARQRRRRRPGRILAWTGVAVLVLLVGGAVGGYLWASSVFGRIDRAEVGTELAGGGSGTNYLLVGIDNARDPDDQRQGVEGSRADTIMILRVQGGSSMLLSLNRDLLVTNPANGQQGRLNATYNAGEANLVRAVTENYQIPVHRYLEVDFASFGGLVDAFGGIEVDFPHPALDRGSGLVVPEAGPVQLDGDQALAYVRSRFYTEVIDGQEVPQGGLPDVNRAERQQIFLREIMQKGGSSRNPLSLMSAASKMSGGLRIDDDMTLLDAGRFAWRMGRLDPETVVLPVVPRTTSGGAAILEPGPGADEVLARFR